MNAIALDQTVNYLARRVQRWDRRLRLVTSLIWGPRAVIGGLFFGVTLAVVSRLRPWLLPEEIAVATAGTTLALLIGLLGPIWLWPRSVVNNARRFDYRFGLKERVSTALELAGGLIPLPAGLGERQLQDAIGAAEHVNVRTYLPLRVRWLELPLLLVLAIVLAYLLLTPNPQNDELLAQRDLQDAVDAQAEELEDAIATVEENPALSEAEREVLAEPLQEALDTLQQQDVSQQEAVAALAEAQQVLDELGDGMRPEQETAYQQAAGELAGSEMTQDLAESTSDADFERMARDLDSLADDVQEQDLTRPERNDLAERLERTAERLEATNPALAEKLREAAEALRRGDQQAAQEALREAAEILEQQHEQLQNSELAQSAQAASQQVEQSQRELARAGRPQQTPDARQPGQQSQQAQQQQPGQQPQSGQIPDQGAQSAGEQSGAQAGSQGQQSGAEPSAGASEQTGEGAPEGAGAAEGEAAGEMAGAAGEQGGAQQQTGDSNQGDTAGGANAPSAGEGEGGAGSESVSGQAGGVDAGQQPANNAPDGDFEAYNPENDPFNLGGESADTVDVGGQGDVPGEGPVREGELAPNPEGEASATYSGAFNDYEDIVSDALESGRIPLDQRDVIHDYFSRLAE